MTCGCENNRHREQQAGKLELLGELAGGIAHDLNNLLTVITGYTELLRPHVQHEEARQYLDLAAAAGERGASLLAHLLDFSRQREPKLIELALNDSVLEATRLMARLLPGN